LGGPFNGHACPGFGTIILNPALVTANIGHVLLAQQTNDITNNDTTIVVGAPPTATPSPTFTPVPTNTPTNTPLPTPSPTPGSPYIVIFPDCGPGPNIQFNLQGYNWPTNQSVTLSWQGVPQIVLQANTHPGSFTYTWTFNGLGNGTYTVSALSGTAGATASDTFTIPCAGQPTPTPGATFTPSPADLIAVGPPKLLSAPPLIAYRPMQFSVAITNTGDLDVDTQFFVDIYLDPTTILTDRIPLVQSDGYAAVSSLAGGASRVITITSPYGFTNNPTNHQVYGMVDSVLQIDEVSEINNVTNPLTVNNVTPAATPTPTVPSSGIDEISGFALIVTDKAIPQFRAFITLLSGTTIIDTAVTDVNGYYQFDNVGAGTYSVSACVQIDDSEWYGVINGIAPPNTLAYIGMFEAPCP